MNDVFPTKLSNDRMLDNPVWHALKSHQARFATGDDSARRYAPDVSPFGAVAAASDGVFLSLASVVTVGTTVVLIDSDPKDERTWEYVRRLSVVQMVYAETAAAVGTDADSPEESGAVVDLTREDVPEMLDLVGLTHPGPFENRTIELGRYIAVRADGRIAAMAGQRFHLPGFREISAVCTHPDHQRRGYARRLILRLIRDIRRSGEIPFLHVATENTGAQALYRAMGFTVRAEYPLCVLKRR